MSRVTYAFLLCGYRKCDNCLRWYPPARRDFHGPHFCKRARWWQRVIYG